MVGKRRHVVSVLSCLTLSLALASLGACAGEVATPPGEPDDSETGADDEEHVGGADQNAGDGDGDGDGDDDTVVPPGDGDVGDGDVGDGDDTTDQPTDSTRAGFKLVWSDEFDGTEGTLPNQDKWRPDVGGDGWGNNQQEFDTDRAENASLDGAGHLRITARREPYQGREYTSARLNTSGKFEQAYGRFEARMKLPEGQGIWPAFWMLGNNIGDVGWPGCGEIDIMESIGKEASTMYGTLHGPGYSGAEGITSAYNLPNARFVDGFHTFAVEWEPEVIRWYVDDTLYVTRTPADLPGGAAWVYDHDFFIILNLAVGGLWPGYPDGSTVFPQTLTIDHVRVYESDAP